MTCSDYEIEADTWEEAMSIHSLRMGSGRRTRTLPEVWCVLLSRRKRPMLAMWEDLLTALYCRFFRCRGLAMSRPWCGRTKIRKADQYLMLLSKSDRAFVTQSVDSSFHKKVPPQISSPPKTITPTAHPPKPSHIREEPRVFKCKGNLRPGCKKNCHYSADDRVGKTQRYRPSPANAENNDPKQRKPVV